MVCHGDKVLGATWDLYCSISKHQQFSKSSLEGAGASYRMHTVTHNVDPTSADQWAVPFCQTTSYVVVTSALEINTVCQMILLPLHYVHGAAFMRLVVMKYACQQIASRSDLFVAANAQ